MLEAFEDHFSGVSAGYRAFRPGYPAALFEWLASVSPGRERAVDLGCGSGQASVGLARHFGEVIGVDPSAEQIARAEPAPRLRYLVAPAEATGLLSACADLVTAAQSAHWFDPERLRRELERLARPAAVFAALTYGLTRIDPAVDEVVLRLFRDVLGPHWPPETAHVGTGYRSLPFPWPEIAALPWYTWRPGRSIASLATSAPGRRPVPTGGRPAPTRSPSSSATCGRPGDRPARSGRWRGTSPSAPAGSGPASLRVRPERARAQGRRDASPPSADGAGGLQAGGAGLAPSRALGGVAP